MQAPKIPDNEPERLAALQNLNLLDTPIQENFERITRITQALFNVPIVAFTLVDEERQWFKSIQGLDVCETSREVSFCGHVINQDALFVVNDTLQDTRFADNPLVTGEPHIRFYAGYPVHTVSGERIGSLCIIDTKPRQFSDKDLLQLRDMAKLVEVELKSSKTQYIQNQLNAELLQAKRQAFVDGLTRLWNRSGIEQLVKKQINVAKETGKDFGIALIDIDNFKMVNDTYGHSAGDVILRTVAKRLLAGYKETDCIGRWGGEEFLVIIDGNDANELFEDADHARKVISATPIIYENLEITITITTGVSYFDPNDPSELHHLVSEADKALYAGKRSGKNVVKISLDVRDTNVSKE